MSSSGMRLRAFTACGFDLRPANGVHPRPISGGTAARLALSLFAASDLEADDVATMTDSKKLPGV